MATLRVDPELRVHVDHLGTPQMLTDDTGAVLWDASYRPFGEASVAGSVAFNPRFPGQYFDAETGPHYNMMRDYDTGLGRYVQSDPIGLQGGWNTYAYASGNPLTRIDPAGCTDQDIRNMRALAQLFNQDLPVPTSITCIKELGKDKKGRDILGLYQPPILPGLFGDYICVDKSYQEDLDCKTLKRLFRTIIHESIHRREWQKNPLSARDYGAYHQQDDYIYQEAYHRAQKYDQYIEDNYCSPNGCPSDI